MQHTMFCREDFWFTLVRSTMYVSLNNADMLSLLLRHVQSDKAWLATKEVKGFSKIGCFIKDKAFQNQSDIFHHSTRCQHLVIMRQRNSLFSMFHTKHNNSYFVSLIGQSTLDISKL